MNHQANSHAVMHARLSDRSILILINICLLSLALSGSWFTDIGLGNYSLIKFSVAGIGSGILLLLTLWRLSYKPYVTVYVSWIKSSFLLLFLLGAISLLWSVNKDFTISKWLLWWVGFGTFITAYHCQPDKQLLYGLALGLLVCAGLIASIGILQHLFGFSVLAQHSPPAATFGNKNVATHVIVLALPISLYLLAAKHTRVLNIWLITLTIAIIMAYIAYTQTRSSWVAITAQVIFIGVFLLIYRQRLHKYIFWQRNKTIACWVSFGIFLLLINFGPSGWAFFFSSALERLSSVSSANARLEIWAMTLTMILDNPLWGSGLGSWYHNEMQEGYSRASAMEFLRAHNDVLELATELGLVGVILLLAGAIAITLSVLSILRKHDINGQGLIEQGTGSDLSVVHANMVWGYFLLWVALAGSFVQMQFTFPYQEAVPMFLLGLYIGLIARYSEDYIPAIKTLTFPLSKGCYWVLQGVAVLFVVLTVVIYVDWLRKNHAINDIISHQTIDQEKLPTPYIQPNNYQASLRFLTNQYADIDNYHFSGNVAEQALTYWPNNHLAMEKLLNASLQLRDYNKAWEMIRRLRAFGYRHYYIDDIAELIIYKNENFKNKMISKFISLLNEDETLLAQQQVTYRNLLQLSIQVPELTQFSQYLYNKSVQYHGYDCRTEQNIAEYYWATGAYAQALKHLAIIQHSDNNGCLNPAWAELMDKHRLAIMLDQAKSE